MKKLKRKIIKINEELCNGCGNCIPACPEQAIQIIDTPNGPKARLVKEFYCDGLGACLGACPTGALTIEEREADEYNEEATIARIKEVAPEMVKVHLDHLKEHAEELPEHHSHKMPLGFSGCPSAKTMSWSKERSSSSDTGAQPAIQSELRQWPIQLHLVSPLAQYFQKADLLLAADCVAYAVGDFHRSFLKGKAIAIACPKLDEGQEVYVEKLVSLINDAKINTITVMIMEVPCCRGLVAIVQEALKEAKRKVPVKVVTVGIRGGEILSEEWL